MKKITLAFLSIIIASPAFANIHINGKVATAVIKEHVPADKLNATLTAYNNVLKKSGVGSMRYGISASGLWDVCAAAGWDIKPKGGTGYNKCNAFVKALLKKGTVTYKEVCGDDKGKTGPQSKEYCVTDFKSVKVNQQPALEIAKLYACIKHKDCSVQCSSKHRTSWNDDYIKCTSQNKLAYYEFQFDSVDNSIDQTIKNGIQTAVCKIHDAPVTLGGYVGGGTNVSSQMVYVDASCAADSPKCAEINKSMSKFGYAAEYKDKTCKINFNTVRNAQDLKTAFGIDNFESCKWDMQAKNAVDLEKQIKVFIAGKAGVSAASVRCDAGFKTYTGKGCKVNGITDFKDDIKTCYAKGQQIDLVFDDINEMWKKYHDATVEGLRCVIQGGSPSGERCIGLGQQQCNMIKKAQLSDCPECKSVYWDTKTQSCVTPAGASANSLKKGVNITLIVGGTLVGVAVTVATAGTAGAPVVAFVLTGIEMVGAGIELTSQLKIDGIADDFLVKSNQCKSASCAKNLIKRHLQRLANLQNDMTTAEVTAIDKEMARLANLIDDDDFWADVALNGLSLSDNQADFWDSWEPEQVARAVGVALQLASVGSAVTKWLVGRSARAASRLTNMRNAVKAKVSRVMTNIEKAPANTLSPKRAALKQQLEGANIVKTERNTATVSKGKMAADDIVELDGKTYKFNSDGSYTLLNEDEKAVKAAKNVEAPSESLDAERNRLEMEIFDTPERFTEAELTAKRERLEVVNKELETAPTNTSVQDMMKKKRLKLTNATATKNTGRIAAVPDYKEPINLTVIEDTELRAVYQKAYEAEKVITNDMVEVAGKTGGDLSGLEYRMKTPESMMGKIARDREAGEVAEGISDAEVASRFSDIVRYTQTGSTETLTQQVGQTLSELEARGYKINKVKNRFDTPTGEYKDMMVQLEHSGTGQKVELQFNTPKNLELKEQGHKFYEITRDMTRTPEERAAAQKAMEEIYKQLETPDGITAFSY